MAWLVFGIFMLIFFLFTFLDCESAVAFLSLALYYSIG